MKKGVGLEPLQVTGVVHEAAAALRAAILDGRLLPGQRLKEMELAASLGISRAPLREAFRMLEREGLVRCEPRKGCFVQEMNLRDAWEVYTLRGILESHAVRLTPPEDLKSLVRPLENVLKDMEKLSDNNSNEALELDIRFHGLLVSKAPHERLRKSHQDMNSLVSYLFFMARRVLSISVTTMTGTHGPLVAAAREGNQALLAELVTVHYGKPAQLLIQKASEPRGGGGWGDMSGR